jgi:cytosine/adenosine deaminase-related metal-dependent hydrolase
VVFARRGIALSTLGRYMDAGIPCGIGTDSFPHNMLDELRLACYGGRILQGSFTAVSTRHAFSAATLGGASIIRRPDLGRLAVGAKADLAVIDMSHPYMQPDYEPLRSLIYSAGDRAVRDVYVDGVRVVKDGRVIAFDIAEDLAMLRKGQEEVVANAPQRDWAGRSLAEMSPRVYPVG